MARDVAGEAGSEARHGGVVRVARAEVEGRVDVGVAGRRDGVVGPVFRPEDGAGRRAAVAFREPQQQVHVLPSPQGLVEPADREERAAPHAQGGGRLEQPPVEHALAEVVAVDEVGVPPDLPPFDPPVPEPDLLERVDEDVDRRVRAEVFHHRADLPGEVGVVAVEEADDLPPRRRDPAVPGPVPALVPAEPDDDDPGVLDPLEQRRRPVGRAVVDDHQLEVGELLVEHAPDGALERARAVVRRQDDRHDRRPLGEIDHQDSSAEGRAGSRRDAGRRSINASAATSVMERTPSHATWRPKNAPQRRR